MVSYLDELLHAHATSLSDISFIAIDKGPGAFTSLRVSIATANGIGFARHIPLVGIDGLEALYEEAVEKLQQPNGKPHINTVVCLLNAYNNDAYFYIKNINNDNEKQPLYGCKNSEELLIDIREFCGDRPFVCAGNGATLYATLIQKVFGDQALFNSSMPEVASAQKIGLMAYDKICHPGLDQGSMPCEKTYKIIPNYLKTQNFAIKKPIK